jgi:hypothetical protein
LLRLVWIPSLDQNAVLSTMTIDVQAAKMASGWARIDGTERHWGALGHAHTVAAVRGAGGLYLLSNSGPTVPSVAQSFELFGISSAGTLIDGLDLDAPGPVSEVALAESMGGAAVIASITGKGVAAHFLDEGGPWREGFAFVPFRKAGDGPLLRNGSSLAVLPAGALPFDATAALGALFEHCPMIAPTGPRALLMLCEEGTADAPLAARVTVRTAKL